MMRRKLLHRMMEVCGTTRRMMDELIVEERLLIYIYIYIFIHRCINFFCHTCVTSATSTFLASLLQCSRQIFCMNYIQIVVFLYIILSVIILFYFLCQ